MYLSVAMCIKVLIIDSYYRATQFLGCTLKQYEEYHGKAESTELSTCCQHCPLLHYVLAVVVPLLPYIIRDRPNSAARRSL